MSRTAAAFVLGGIAAVVLTALGANPIVVIVGLLMAALLLDGLGRA